jgi:AbrB family looped-hinge helix DNA binding protein
LAISNVVKIDKKGRILIPRPLRDTIGITEEMYVVLSADPEGRKITISPLAGPKAELVEIKIGMPDTPGSLAKIAKVLADTNVDLLASESRTLERGKLAEWRITADVSKKSCNLKDIEKRLIEKGGAKKAEMKLLI